MGQDEQAVVTRVEKCATYPVFQELDSFSNSYTCDYNFIPYTSQVVLLSISTMGSHDRVVSCISVLFAGYKMWASGGQQVWFVHLCVSGA